MRDSLEARGERRAFISRNAASDRAGDSDESYRPRIRSALVFVGYLVSWTAFFGAPLLHDSIHIGGNGPDPKLFIWSMEWWHHSVAHPFDNPLFSHQVWAPDGLNLAWVTTVPLLGVAAAPITSLAGPLVSYNLWVLLAPPLAGYTCFLLCASVTRRFAPSVAGGALFCWSSYMIAHTRGGHLNLLAVFFVPLICRAFVRFARGEITRNGFVWRLTALLVGQFLISTEVFATLVMFGVVAGALAWFLSADRQALLRAYARPTAVAFGICLIWVGPFLAQAFLVPAPTQAIPTVGGSTDLLNLVVPTTLTFVGGQTFKPVSDSFVGVSLALSGLAAYLGLPLLLIIVTYARRTWGDATCKFLVWMFAITTFFSLGAWLHVAGASLTPLPWRLAGSLPLLEKLLPNRFMMYATLCASVVLALWLAQRTSWQRWLVGCAAVLILAPVPAFWHWRTEITTPRFFAEGTYRSVLREGEDIIVVGPGTAALPLVWQAESGMYFDLSGGYMGGVPTEIAGTAIADVLLRQQCPTEAGLQELFRYAATNGVTKILFYEADDGSSCPVLPTQSPGIDLGGVVIYETPTS